LLAAVRRHPVRAFFALSYLISWSCWAPLLLHGDVIRAGVGWATHLPGLPGPPLAPSLLSQPGLGPRRAGVRVLQVEPFDLTRMLDPALARLLVRSLVRHRGT